LSTEKPLSTLPIKVVNFGSRELSIDPESPKPTVFIDSKGDLSHNPPPGQREHQNDIPNSSGKYKENLAHESSYRNAMVVDSDDEVPRFKSKTTQARKRTTIVISDDEGADKGAGGSLRSTPAKPSFPNFLQKKKSSHSRYNKHKRVNPNIYPNG